MMMKNSKGFSRMRSWPAFKILSRHSPEGSGENHEEPHIRYPVVGVEI
jgi:hypothetical protein